MVAIDLTATHSSPESEDGEVTDYCDEDVPLGTTRKHQNDGSDQEPQHENCRDQEKADRAHATLSTAAGAAGSAQCCSWSRSQSRSKQANRRHMSGPSGRMHKKSFDRRGIQRESEAHKSSGHDLHLGSQRLPKLCNKKEHEQPQRGTTTKREQTSRSRSRNWTRVPMIPHTKVKSEDPADGDVYVGSLPYDTTAQDVIEGLMTVFKRLPEFQQRYSDWTTPLIEPQNGVRQRSSFFFLRFVDRVLTATAVRMTGVMIRGRSVRITHSADGPSPEEEAAQSLDLSDLRTDGTLPWTFKPAQLMLNEVFVGGLTFNMLTSNEVLVEKVTKCILSIPAVAEKWPHMTRPVLRFRSAENGTFAFMEVANEFLASTLVSLGRMSLPTCTLRFNWPSNVSDAADRAPPSLCTNASMVRTLSSHVKEEPGFDCKGEGPVKEEEEEEVKETEEACMVYMGGIRGLEIGILVATLTQSLKKLPSYRSAYPDKDFSPVKNVVSGTGVYAFARMGDPVLASTVVALGMIWVNGQRVMLNRPSMYDPTVVPPAPALDLSVPDTFAHGVKAAHPPKCMSGRATKRIPPVPPTPPPPIRPSTLYISNVQGAGQVALKQHLLHVAMTCPDINVEDGPPVVHVLQHANGYSAFAQMRDAEVAQTLLPIYNTTPFDGRYLVVQNAAIRRGLKVPSGEQQTNAQSNDEVSNINMEEL